MANPVVGTIGAVVLGTVLFVGLRRLVGRQQSSLAVFQGVRPLNFHNLVESLQGVWGAKIGDVLESDDQHEDTIRLSRR